ncbi:MAG: hypothetical protein QOE31_3888 [Solirubrobacteraceae bacterium]|jgi:hypothetical protein|nr:hypothetical protein [Solirubrobacteraceae bacterium]
MSLVRSVIEHFVMPGSDPRAAAHEDVVPADEVPDRACAQPAPRTPSGIAVLAAAADLQPLASALGLALAKRERAPCAAVLVWSGERGAGGVAWRAPALPAARRLALALAARGHVVHAAGRLVVVRLPAAPQDAAGQARRAIAAAGSAPAVLALSGPRVAAFDDLLDEQDLVVVATARGTDPALARLAVAGLSSADAGGRVCVCELPPAHAARTLAAAGLTLLPSARRALAAAVGALP